MNMPADYHQTLNQPSQHTQYGFSSGKITAGLLYQERGVLMSQMSREEVDAKIGAAEARGDAKIATVLGKLDLVVSKLDGVAATLVEVRADNRSTKSTVITSAIAMVLGLGALIVGLAFGLPSVFSMGAQIRDMVHSENEASHVSQPGVSSH